jgi:hypothetical protein
MFDTLAVAHPAVTANSGDAAVVLIVAVAGDVLGTIGIDVPALTNPPLPYAMYVPDVPIVRITARISSWNANGPAPLVCDAICGVIVDATPCRLGVNVNAPDVDAN